MLSYWIPVSALGVAVVLAMACSVIEFRRRRFRWFVVYAALLALQPGWGLLWQALSTGGIRVRADCGYSQRSLSLFLLGATIAVCVFVLQRATVRRRTFLFGFAVAFTSMSVVAELPFFGLPLPIPHELEASLFTGFGGPPWFLLLLVSVCVLLFVVQRPRTRTAV
jgi:hypothetical protein